MHLLSGEIDIDNYTPMKSTAASSTINEERIIALEQDVEQLKQQVIELQAMLESLTE